MVKGGKELGYVKSYETGVTLFGPSCMDDVYKVDACING